MVRLSGFSPRNDVGVVGLGGVSICEPAETNPGFDPGTLDNSDSDASSLANQPELSPGSSAQVSAGLPVWTNDQIAYQLTNGFWTWFYGEAGGWFPFGVGPAGNTTYVTTGGTLTYNVTGLTADGQYLAQEALQVWSDATGIVFNQTAGAAQITFDDEDAGAYAASESWFNVAPGMGITYSAAINISSDWLAAYGSTIGTYSFQTYIHEIGHALGLGHAGNYNGSASYPDDALFANDAWSTSAMSYFSQARNTYFSSQGFTPLYLGTPMAADLIAVSNLYGQVSTTRTGDTTYGFNNTSGRAIYDPSIYPNLVVTIIDSGGIDTLDYSGFAATANQRIDLTEESFSNIGGHVGNLVIARGTIIENVVSGGGDDTIIGNGADNILDGGAGIDTLNGGLGNDTLRGGAGNDIIDGEGGSDTADYSDAPSGVTVKLYLTTIQDTVGAGSDQLLNIENLTGSNYDDILAGNSSNNTISGGSGNDTLIAYGGNNLLLGGPGNDFFSSGSGSDTMQGGEGDDRYYVDTAGDTVIENPGEGIDQIATHLAAYILPANLENLVGNSLSGQALTGNGLDNIILAPPGSAADTLNGAGGVDTASYANVTNPVTVSLLLQGAAQNTSGAGMDLLQNFENLAGSTYNDTLTGDDNPNSIFGGAGNDDIHGLGGDDILQGGAGDDTLDGGDGNDTADYSDALSAVTVNLGTATPQDTGGGGIDLLISIERITGSALGDTLVGNAADNVLSGGAGNDFLSVSAGANLLLGGDGNDFLFTLGGTNELRGGTGDDFYGIVADGSQIIEDTGGGTDRVATSFATYTLPDNVEELFGSSTAGQSLTGNNLDNRIVGNDGIDTLEGGAGADVLDGGLGADMMAGGTGNDVYVVDNIGDVVTELAGEGTDEVRTALASYALASNLEKLTGTSAAGQTLMGNELNNVISGGAGADTIDGAGGNDVINGLAGNDVMKGGAGNDAYYVYDAGDVVTELYDEGTDIVYAYASHTLGANVENLTLLAAGLTGTGNAAGNLIYGSSGADTIHGMGSGDRIDGGGGNDTLYGDDGADAIWGGAGNDVIYGGAGIDYMVGGSGDDTYYVTDAGDTAIEQAGEGTDTVYASTATHQLRPNIEVLIGTLSTGQTLLGNYGADTIQGGAGNDVINGLAGNDTMKGGAGNDAYYVYDAGDTIVENPGEGTDTVYTYVSHTLAANVENLTLLNAGNTGTGNDLANTIYGSSGIDTIFGMGGADQIASGGGADTIDAGAGDDLVWGGAGNDVIRGGLGFDRLRGEAGADRFVFGEGETSASRASADRLLDFSQAEGDKIDLSLIDANSTGGAPGDQAFAFIGSAAFSNVAGELRYEQSGGFTYVEGDTNGDGIADFSIQLGSILTPVAADFVL